MSQPDGLRRATERRVRAKRLTVEAAIQALLEEGGAMTVSNVARRAGVSMVYIHGHPDLRDQISRLREERPAEPHPGGPAQSQSALASLEQENRLLHERVADLEARVEALRSALWGNDAHRPGRTSSSSH